MSSGTIWRTDVFAETSFGVNGPDTWRKWAPSCI